MSLGIFTKQACHNQSFWRPLAKTGTAAFLVFTGLMEGHLMFAFQGIRKSEIVLAVAMLSNAALGKSFFIEVLGREERWQDMNNVLETVLC